MTVNEPDTPPPPQTRLARPGGSGCFRIVEKLLIIAALAVAIGFALPTPKHPDAPHFATVGPR